MTVSYLQSKFWVFRI